MMTPLRLFYHLSVANALIQSHDIIQFDVPDDNILGKSAVTSSKHDYSRNEDGTLTEYGESLIAGYSGMSSSQSNSNTVRNINGQFINSLFISRGH